jgi:cell division protein FtsB
MLALALLFAGGAAEAADQRYVLEKVEGGLIRLDTKTGSLSHCSVAAGEWTCRSLLDDRRLYQDEVAALEGENAALKARIGALETRIRELEAKRGSRLELPSDEEIDRLMGLIDRMMRRFLDFARSLDGGKGGDI